jgi:ribosomal protein S18 acetylase RimI-like enzyme
MTSSPSPSAESGLTLLFLDASGFYATSRFRRIETGAGFHHLPAKMSIKFTDDPGAVDWSKLSDVFKRTPLGNRNPDKLQEAFQNSPIRCFVWNGGELIGVGRAITDGVRYSVIFDVVLVPEHQGRGIGRQIMDFLAGRSKAPSILLYAAPQKEGFYAKLGYRKMKTAMAKFPNPEMQQQSGYIE